MSIKQGYGDSMKELRDLWKDKSIKEIYDEIRRAKKEGVI